LEAINDASLSRAPLMSKLLKDKVKYLETELSNGNESPVAVRDLISLSVKSGRAEDSLQRAMSKLQFPKKQYTQGKERAMLLQLMETSLRLGVKSLRPKELASSVVKLIAESPGRNGTFKAASMALAILDRNSE
jgi:hypothetical protein